MRTTARKALNQAKGIAGQSPAAISAIAIFLACNFNNMPVKRHFDGLKKKWEETLPVAVYLSDKVQAGGARDIWKDITEEIKQANLCIFDLTTFRPNVSLELGYALAIKRLDQIVICRDLTPNGKATKQREEWQLSDISHLFRREYKTFADLDDTLLEHVERLAPVINFYALMEEVERRRTLSSHSYIGGALEILKQLRDKGPIRRDEFRRRLIAQNVDPKKIETLLVRFKLATPDPGRNGFWKIID